MRIGVGGKKENFALPSRACRPGEAARAVFPAQAPCAGASAWRRGHDEASLSTLKTTLLGHPQDTIQAHERNNVMPRSAKALCALLVALASLATGATTARADHSYTITSKLSGKVLDVQGGVTDDGAAIIQWPSHGGANQQWKIEPVGRGYVRIVSRLSGKVLDVAGGVTDDGATIIQWPWHGGDNQLWRIEKACDGYVRIISKLSGKALDVQGGVTDEGAAIIQWPWHGGDNQLWRLEHVRR
jgi:hypothetical protein